MVWFHVWSGYWYKRQKLQVVSNAKPKCRDAEALFRLYFILFFLFIQNMLAMQQMFNVPCDAAIVVDVCES